MRHSGLWCPYGEGRRALQKQAHGIQTKAYHRKPPKTQQRERTETHLPGWVKVKSNTRELATLRIFRSCSRTYSLLNAVFKVSKNECNVSCKGNIWNKYIAFWNSKGQNFFQLQEHKTGIIPWTPAWENYLAPNLCLEMCSSFTWVRERESHKRVREEWHFDSLFKNMFNKTSTNCGQSYKKNNW